MEAKELRVGNFVKDRGDKILKIDYWERKDMVAQSQYLENIEVHPLTEDVEYLTPIPLTEEWLLGFGFEIPTLVRSYAIKYISDNEDPSRFRAWRSG